MLFYIIGILGSGTSALASLLIQMGHNVRGCDIKEAIQSYQGYLEVEDINSFKALDNMTYIIGNSFTSSYQACLDFLFPAFVTLWQSALYSSMVFFIFPFDAISLIGI